MKKLLVSIFLVFLFVPSCVQNGIQDNVYKTLKPLSDCIEINDISSQIDSIGYIQLETNPKSFLTLVNKVLITSSGNFIVLDYSSSIIAFNEKGKYLFSFGRKGNGRGEFLSVYDICISDDKKNLLALTSSNTIIKYQLHNGVFIEAITIPRVDSKTFDAIAPSSKDGFYLFSANPFDVNDFSVTYKSLVEFDNNGAIKAQYLPRKDFVFTMGLITQSHDNSYIIRPQEGDHIVYRIKNGIIKAEYKIEFGDKYIPKKYIYSFGGNPIEHYKDYLLSNYYKIPIYFHESKDILYFSCGGNRAENYEFIYSIKTLKGIRWKGQPQSIIASSKDAFYALVDFNELTNLKEKKKIISPLIDYLSRYSNIKYNEDQNPVLFKIHFKIK